MEKMEQQEHILGFSGVVWRKNRMQRATLQGDTWQILGLAEQMRDLGFG